MIPDIRFNKVFIISNDHEYFCGKVEQALMMKLKISSSDIHNVEEIIEDERRILNLEPNGVYLMIFDPSFSNSSEQFEAWKSIEAKIRDCSFHYLEPLPRQEWKSGKAEILMRIHVYNSDGTAAYLDFNEDASRLKFPEILKDLEGVVGVIDWQRENLTDFWPYTQSY